MRDDIKAVKEGMERRGEIRKNTSETDSVGHHIYFDTEYKGEGEVKDDSLG